MIYKLLLHCRNRLNLIVHLQLPMEFMFSIFYVTQHPSLQATEFSLISSLTESNSDDLPQNFLLWKISPSFFIS